MTFESGTIYQRLVFTTHQSSAVSKQVQPLTKACYIWLSYMSGMRGTCRQVYTIENATSKHEKLAPKRDFSPIFVNNARVPTRLALEFGS